MPSIKTIYYWKKILLEGTCFHIPNPKKCLHSNNTGTLQLYPMEATLVRHFLNFFFFFFWLKNKAKKNTSNLFTVVPAFLMLKQQIMMMNHIVRLNIRILISAVHSWVQIKIKKFEIYNPSYFWLTFTLFFYFPFLKS